MKKSLVIVAFLLTAALTAVGQTQTVSARKEKAKPPAKRHVKGIHTFATCKNVCVQIYHDLINDPSGKTIAVNPPEPVHASKGRMESVEWWSTEPQHFKIVFTQSPFPDNTFTVPVGGSVTTGKVKDKTPYGGTEYKYTITDDAGNKLDPAVIIDQ